MPSKLTVEDIISNQQVPVRREPLPIETAVSLSLAHHVHAGKPVKVTASGVTITLPAVNNLYYGETYTILSGANGVTINVTGTDAVNGGTAGAGIVNVNTTGTAGDSITLSSDSAGWNTVRSVGLWTSTSNSQSRFEQDRVKEVFAKSPRQKSGLVLYVPMLGETDATVKDYSENHSDGIILEAFTANLDGENPSISLGEDKAHNGFSIGDTYNYLIHTTEISRTDKNWNIELTNSDPFTPLTATPDGLGSGKYYNGKLYVIAVFITGPPNTEETIAIYDATTLAYDSEFDISATVVNPSSLEIVPEHGTNGVIYVLSKTESTIYQYDLSDGTFLRSFVVTPTLVGASPGEGPQDLSFRNGFLYIHSNESEFVHRVDLQGNARQFVDLTAVGPAQHNEGINWSDQDDLLLHFYGTSPTNDKIFTYQKKDFFGTDVSSSRKMLFTADHSHRIRFPSDSSTDDMTTFTMCIWVEHDGVFTDTTSHLITTVTSAGSDGKLLWIQKAGTDDASIRAAVNHSVTGANYVSSTLLAKDTMYFIACTYDTLRGDDERFDIFWADLTGNTVQEVSYASSTEPSGTQIDDAGNNITVCGRDADDNRNLNGKAAYARIYDRVLTIEELQQIFDSEKP